MYRFRLATSSWGAIAVLVLLTMRSSAMAQSNEVNQSGESVTSPLGGLPNLKLPTLGGKQFWTDRQWRRGWRIQQSAITGHWRLLDDENTRQAWGSRAACDAALKSYVPHADIEADQVVILLHGLGRSASSMQGLGEAIARAQPHQIAYFEYASMRGPVSQHAAALREVVAGLPPGPKIDFVGHSMGNIVVRHAVGDWMQAGDQATLDRIHRVVMLGPPNQGSSIARLMSRTGVFGWVAGPGGLELGPQWSDIEAKLATPSCPFGIIAGRLPDETIANPLVDGHGDFIVSVEETKLDGAADFLEVPCMHTFIMDDERVQQATLRFLDTGRFE